MTLHDLFTEVSVWTFFLLMMGLVVPSIGAFMRLGRIQERLEHYVLDVEDLKEAHADLRDDVLELKSKVA